MARPTQAPKFTLLMCLLFTYLLISPDSTIALNIGDEAPDFTLLGTNGESVSLSQFKGKKHVLVQFYSLDFNPT